MNILEIVESIKNTHFEKYNYQYGTFTTNTNDDYYTVTNLQEVDKLIRKLNKIPELAPFVEIFENDSTQLERRFHPEGHFDIFEKNELDAGLAKLKNSIEAIKIYLESTIKKDSANSFKIRTPDISNFEELGKVMNDLKIAFSIPVADSKEAQPLNIERVESGSFWMYVIGGTVGVQLVGGIVWAAAVLRKKHSEADFVKQQVEGYKLENNQKKILFDAQNEMLKEVIKSEALHLENQFYESPNSDPERTNRLILAIKTCQDLIDRNAQIRPSLTAPEEVSNLFPNFQNLNLIESQIKKIEEHSKN